MRTDQHMWELPKGTKTRSIWMPSAAYSPTHGGLMVYVKHHAMSNNPNITIKANSNSYVWLDTPDRELIFVNTAHGVNSLRPLDDGFHEAVLLSPFHDCMRDTGIEVVMTNYPQHLQRKDLCLHHRKEGFRPNGVRYVADSGGFQLMSGRVHYLDPKKVVEWYNTNTDYGMVLDLPTVIDDENILMETARIQKRNTDIMMEHKAPHVGLINILHGYTVDQQINFHDIVDDKRINMLAVADAYVGETIQSLARLLGVIWGVRKYDLYHMLGIYNLGVMPFLIRANATGLIPNVLTFDSSTHIQSARVRMYHHQRMPNRPPERMIIGMENPSCSRPNPYKHLPCSCPVCSTIKYMDVFSVLDGAVSTYLLMMHNMFEINRYVNMMNHYAHTLDDQQYEEMMIDMSSTQRMLHNGYQVQTEGQLGNHNAKKVVRSIMDFFKRVQDKSDDAQRCKLAKQTTGDDGMFASYTKKEFMGTRDIIKEVGDDLGVNHGSALSSDAATAIHLDIEGNDVSSSVDGDVATREYRIKLIKRIIKRYNNHDESKSMSGKKAKDVVKKNGGSIYNSLKSNKAKKSKIKTKSGAKLNEATNRLAD